MTLSPVTRSRPLVVATLGLLVSVLMITTTTRAARAAQAGADGGSGQVGWSAALQSGFPKARISNGAVQAVVYLPDAKDGYYRASRFDWAGVVPCLTYKDHSYFGVWF